MQRRMCWISDEGLIPSSYIRAVNLFAKPLGDAFAYKSSRQARATDVLNADFVVFQRCRSRRALGLFYTAYCANRKIIFDIDDYLLELPKESTPLRSEEIGNLRRMIAGADLVTCSTAPLAEKLRQLNPNVEAVPNSVEPRGTSPIPSDGPVRLLISNTDYFKLTDSRKAFFQAIRDILERHETIQLIVVGRSCAEVSRLRGRFPDRVIVHEGFIPNYNQYLELLDSLRPDIGLTPLEANPFHSYKSNIKYLDLAASGIPAVFSDVSPYRESISHGIAGILATNTRDGWFDAVDRLAANPEHRRALGQAALADVTLNFHPSNRLAQWNAIMARLESSPPNSARIGGNIDDILDCMVVQKAVQRPIWKEVVWQLLDVMPPRVRDDDLIRDASGRVYLVENGHRRHIVDPLVFKRHGFESRRIRRVGRLKQRLLPMGDPIEE